MPGRRYRAKQLFAGSKIFSAGGASLRKFLPAALFQVQVYPIRSLICMNS